MERKIITNSSDLRNPEYIAVQVSNMIEGYNASHPFEMLPKKPDVVLCQLDSGLSVVLVSPEDDSLLFHGSLYPCFENGEERIIGRQIVELGSWMVPQDRWGENHGTHGVGALIALSKEKWDNPLLVSTHKRIGALKVSQHNGLEDIPYSAVPYLTYLTCTCVNCSETVGKVCSFRRTSQIVVYEDGKIDCSLVVTSRAEAIETDQKMRSLHQEILGDIVMPGPITIESMTKERRFFDELKNYIT